MADAIPTSVTARYGEPLENELKCWLEVRDRTGQHYEMLAYHMGWLDESLHRNPGPRGKRFRPLLCLLSCDAVGGDSSGALPTAASIEFLHNFSLIHDDIEDHDESRHHRPALWKLWGESLAINAGDAMLALSGLAALSSKYAGVAARFQETALALTEGQYLDMSFESRSDVSATEYFQMISLKTGALITYSCLAGGWLGDGSIEQVDGLESFGRHFGLAFQIFDDIRGIWAPLAQTGKVPAKDIINRKKSLPVVLALERAGGRDEKRLIDYYVHGAAADPDEIAGIIEDLGVRQDVQDTLQEHLDEGFRSLQSAGLDEPYVTELEQVARGLVDMNPKTIQ